MEKGSNEVHKQTKLKFSIKKMTENKFENKGMTQLLQNGSFFFFFHYSHNRASYRQKLEKA